jgi:hypothetical protein
LQPNERPASLVVTPPQLRKPAPRRPALDVPITQPDVLHNCRRDHVSLSVGQGLLFSADLEAQRERTSLRNSSVTVGAQGMRALENVTRTGVKILWAQVQIVVEKQCNLRYKFHKNKN